MKKDSNRRWIENNRDKYNTYQRKWYSENFERRRCQNKKSRDARKQQLFTILNGSKCYICGFDDSRALQIDHKNGDGKKDRIRFTNMGSVYSYYSKHPIEAREKLQILCANCNWIKKHDNKEVTQNKKYGLTQ